MTIMTAPRTQSMASLRGDCDTGWSYREPPIDANRTFTEKLASVQPLTALQVAHPTDGRSNGRPGGPPRRRFAATVSPAPSGRRHVACSVRVVGCGLSYLAPGDARVCARSTITLRPSRRGGLRAVTSRR